MTLFFLFIGLLPMTISGMLLLRAVEHKSPVLLPLERVSLGFLVGSTLNMFIAFLLQITLGLPLTLIGFGVIQLGLLGVALALSYPWEWSLICNPVSLPTGEQKPRWQWTILSVLLGITAIKIVLTSATFLFLTPSFLDDTLDNWNLRGKVFYHTQEFTIELPSAEPGGLYHLGVSSYPPTVPLLKTWLSTLYGEWSEPLINGIHAVWYLVAFSLLFSLLRRRLSLYWSWVGVYALGSIPLFLMHGTNAYADLFLSVHLFAALAPLYMALHADSVANRVSFLRIAAVMTALLTFTKNEGFALYLPGVLIAIAVTLILLVRTQRLSLKQLFYSIGWFAVALLLIAGPWLLFKNMHSMGFGNAKALTTMVFSYHHQVWAAVFVNTFFEGNWLLLFPFFLATIIWQWKRSIMSPIGIFVGFFFLLYCTQLGIYLFTPIATEAIRQTGYARGLIHMTLPVVATVMIVWGQVLEMLKSNVTVERKE